MKSILVNLQEHLERFKEHLKAHFPIYDHRNITSHTITVDNFIIMGREDQNLTGNIRGSVHKG